MDILIGSNFCGAIDAFESIKQQYHFDKFNNLASELSIISGIFCDNM